MHRLSFGLPFVVAAALFVVGTSCVTASTGIPFTPAFAAAASAEMKREGLVGRDVFASDQVRVGQVEDVESASDGSVRAIRIRTGGFLGFGSKTVAVPIASMSMRGSVVQLQLSSQEVQSLPAANGGT